MKKAVCAAALSLALLSPSANASGYIQPVTPEIVVVEDTAASNQGIFVPIFALLLLIMLHHG
jgi:hypothetical protein